MLCHTLSIAAQMNSFYLLCNIPGKCFVPLKLRRPVCNKVNYYNNMAEEYLLLTKVNLHLSPCLKLKEIHDDKHSQKVLFHLMLEIVYIDDRIEFPARKSLQPYIFINSS